MTESKTRESEKPRDRDGRYAATGSQLPVLVFRAAT
ncbi:hypothetical protein Kole_1831 [Kosmotoga olearia TBF 19.5.1]|uniref:Uncharacterized protein n=1 Tax=Kosmotoga olearia (strain ATCC BAA-1733 / DSM 21960 / TBF 19.5.1) TaxID=521045 RepID=C5CGD2_KOSOT|nr:hypothetical protein Kole_1831 [Kosmotoga olearia TBF 19.5.1]